MILKKGRIEKYLNDKVKVKQPTLSEIQEGVDITVIVPAYNEELLLPKIFLDLNKQSYTHFEIIVVDNKSTDASCKIVKTMKKNVNYPLYLLIEDRKGIAWARKRGMDEVILRLFKRKDLHKRHFLVTTDVDIAPGKKWLSHIKNTFSNTSADILCGTHGALWRIEKLIYQKLGIKDYFEIAPNLIEFFHQNNIGEFKLSGPNSAFSVEAYVCGGGITQEYNENGSLMLSEVDRLGKRATKVGCKIAAMNFRIAASRRRELWEILNQQNSYFPIDDKEKNRLFCVRQSEMDLLRTTLKERDKEDWINYRNMKVETIIVNYVLKPLIKPKNIIYSGNDSVKKKVYSLIKNVDFNTVNKSVGKKHGGILTKKTINSFIKLVS